MRLRRLSLPVGLGLAVLMALTFGLSSARAAGATNEEHGPGDMPHDMAGSTKHVDVDHVLPGDMLTYTIHISMAHSGGHHGGRRHVSLTDTLPFSGHVRFMGWGHHPTGATISPDGHVHWDGDMEPGEAHTIQYRMGVEGTVMPGTVLTNHAQLGWHGGGMQLGPVTTAVTLPHGMLALEPHQGGRLQHRYGVTVTVPPDAVTDTTRFEVRPLFTGGWRIRREQVTESGGLRIGGEQGVGEGLMFARRAFELEAVRFGQSLARVSRPLTVTLDHRSGLEPGSLQIWRRDGPREPWATSMEPVSVTAETVVFTTTAPGQFALFGEPAAQLYLPLVRSG